MMLVYFRGKGLWFDFPAVNSSTRDANRRQWDKNNPTPQGRMSKNLEEWEEYQEKTKKWEENNPPPKFTVKEDEISLVPLHFFDFSQPVLDFCPDELNVSGVFLLKKKDEKILRYEKKAIIQILLPCDHPDADNQGSFLFQIDKPYTFTSKNVVLDEVEALNEASKNSSNNQHDNEPLTQPWLIQNSKDPDPKQDWYTPARYFARQFVYDDPTLLKKRQSLTKKVVASLTDVGIKKRGGEKPFDPNTILKALSNIKF